MIPLVAVVSVRHAKGRVRIWAPLFLAWIVLLPFAVILTPFAFAAWLAAGRNPIRACGSALAVFTALSGLVIDVDSPAAKVLVRIH
jgi:hypothetical protein